MNSFVHVNGKPPQANEPPEGFFRLIGREGKDAGLGFSCSTCHQVFYNVSEKAGIRHCGRTEYLASSFFSRLIDPLPKYSPRPVVHRAGANVLVEV